MFNNLNFHIRFPIFSSHNQLRSQNLTNIFWSEGHTLPRVNFKKNAMHQEEFAPKNILDHFCDPNLFAKLTNLGPWLGWLRKFSFSCFRENFAKLSISCFAKFSFSFAKYSQNTKLKFGRNFREIRRKFRETFNKYI